VLWPVTGCAIVSPMERFKTYALAATAIILLFGIAGAISQRVLIERFLSVYDQDPLTIPVDWFNPKEAVPGAAEESLRAADAAERTVPNAILEDVAAYAEAQGSLSLIVVHKGRVQLERYWDDANRETWFNPQSMSKSVLSLLMGIAIEEGHIDAVTDPVGKYIEEWRDDPRGTATIQQTLWMAAGLEQMTTSYDINIFDRGTWYNFGDDFNGMLLDLDQVDKPGTKFDYNNEETNLLGILIERATGQRYADYLSEKLWAPLGLADAAMYQDRPGGAVMKSCCIFSRPYDWTKIGLLIANRGVWNEQQLVPAAWIDAMLTPSPLRDFYGYLVWLGSSYIQKGEFGKPKSAVPVAPEGYHADDMVIFLGYGEQRVWISPSNELVIVRGTRKWAPSWNETRIPNTILDALNPDTSTVAP
jgi:CubicO group peptidase (beta-lactamase class C family)